MLPYFIAILVYTLCYVLGVLYIVLSDKSLDFLLKFMGIGLAVLISMLFTFLLYILINLNPIIYKA